MKPFMDRLYSNIADAKAFQLSFTNFVYIYDDMCLDDFVTTVCEECGMTIQSRDYMVPRSNCKKDYGILHSLDFGVSQKLRDDLIAEFDITTEDFRPIYSKRGELVYYQVTPRHTMLPVYKPNRWIPMIPCKRCGTQRFTPYNFENEREEFYHKITQEALEEMHDLNVTYERFGCNMPLVVVSRRVYDFLVKRYPRTHYYPFFLANDIGNE